MAYLTEDRVRSVLRSRGVQLAESELRKTASANENANFDVFLSHSYQDAQLIAGVKLILENQRLSVFVDWIDDARLDRRAITAKTAKHLQMRMRHCRSLIFATSKTSVDSKWMPWELGYFDGIRPNHTAIFPLVKTPGMGFLGQEYLGICPHIEDIAAVGATASLIVRSSASTTIPLGKFPLQGAPWRG